MRSNEKKRIVVASGNRNKIKEIAEIFDDFEICSQKDMGFDCDVEETGTTFSENALIKARAVVAALGCAALADDSGICVDALHGGPGVFSARYCGRHGADAENRVLLLKNLEDETNRKAHFTSAIALVYPNGEELVTIGETHGEILTEEVGDGGFGYDCIFKSDDLGKSFGEATAEEKNKVSHRFRALQAMRELLREREDL